MGEWDLDKAVLILGQGAEINKYSVTQAFLTEYPDLLIQDKILAGKAFYQVLSKNNTNRRVNTGLINLR